MSITGFNDLTRRLRDCAAALPDPRTGDNTRYSMADIALSAFSVFFTQCPSFLESQRNMKRSRGRSDAQTLFQIEKIPTDNHIRKILDSVQPEHLQRSFGLPVSLSIPMICSSLNRLQFMFFFYFSAELHF